MQIDGRAVFPDESKVSFKIDDKRVAIKHGTPFQTLNGKASSLLVLYFLNVGYRFCREIFVCN